MLRFLVFACALLSLGCHGAELRLGTAHTLNSFSGDFSSSGSGAFQDGYDSASNVNNALGSIDQDDSTSFYVELGFQLSPTAVTLTNPPLPVEWPRSGPAPSPRTRAEPGSSPILPPLPDVSPTLERIGKLEEQIRGLVADNARLAHDYARALIHDRPATPPNQTEPMVTPPPTDPTNPWAWGGGGGAVATLLAAAAWYWRSRAQNGGGSRK